MPALGLIYVYNADAKVAYATFARPGQLSWPSPGEPKMVIFGPFLGPKMTNLVIFGQKPQTLGHFLGAGFLDQKPGASRPKWAIFGRGPKMGHLGREGLGFSGSEKLRASWVIWPKFCLG